MTRKKIIQEQLPEVEEDEVIDGKNVKSKGVYLIPNVITSLALFSAFYSVICSLNNNYYIACIAIIFAMGFDNLDGRVARITDTQSKFGEQFDSMSDLLAFGVAPAILVYKWMLIDLGNFGLLVTFIFILAAALRLARFNANIEVTDKKWFVGLSSPVASAAVLALVLNFNQYHDSLILQAVVVFMVVFSGLLMISNVKFYSFKMFTVGKLPFIHLLLVILYIALLVSYFRQVFLLSCYLYIITGLIITFKDYFKREKTADKINS